MSADGFLSSRSPPAHQGTPGASPPQQPGASKPQYSKRGKITIVACVPCRRRKTKCDGKRPTCSQCQSRDSQCAYDMNEEQRRLTYLRENVETLAEEKSALEQVLWNLKNSTEDESFEILRRIRGGTDPQSLVQQIQASRSLTQVKGDTPLSSSSLAYSISPSVVSPNNHFERLVHTITRASAPEIDEIVSRLRRRDPIDQILDVVKSGDLLHQSRHIPAESNSVVEDGIPSGLYAVSQARPMAGNALTPMLGHPFMTSARAPDAHTPPNIHEYRWTTVTDDKEFISHLLQLYFMWQHSFFQSFPEELFRKDYAAGKTKYCSRVLVNAICAAGCLLSERPEARGDANDPETAGAGFFEEGMRLLNQSDRSSIPTTAGVFLLSHVDGNRGRLGAMWGLVGRSARMALDLNLHLRNDRTPFHELSPEAQAEEAGRIHAFWGCFISDQVTSLTLGRLPQILTNAITVDLPPQDETKDKESWGPDDLPFKKRLGAQASTFQQCASLSKIVNSTLLMFFSPSEIIRGKLLLDEYSKYQSWYQRLPTIVATTDDAPPHILCLHIYYQAAVLLLFRPFLRAKFTESDISPSELCRQSANNISDLFAKHLSLYSVTGLYTFQIQCLLAACTIHIINLPAISSSTALTAACNQFHELIPRNTWALGSLNVIKGLIQKWSIILPGDVEEALYRSHADFPDSILTQFEDPAAPQAELFRPAKRTAFLNPSSQVMQKRQRLAPVQVGGIASAPSPAASTSGPGGQGAIKEQTPKFLFAPFPNQPAPLLGPIHTSTSAETEWNDELSKVAQDFDGLKFEGDGWFDPFMGYQGE